MGLEFRDEDWHRVRETWAAWWAGELERPLVFLEGIEPPDSPLPEIHGFATNFGFDMPADRIIDRFNAHLEARRFYGDAFPKWWLNFGPGILAGFAGARVRSVPETVWFEPQALRPIQEVHVRHDPANPWRKRVHELTQAAVDRWQGRVAVGHTDLGGNLDVAASLRTTEGLLLDLCDAPEEVERLVAEVTQLWLKEYRDLLGIVRTGQIGTTPWATIWSPGTCYMLQSDFCFMISPKMFERFVLPDLVACCDALDHGFYHLDGPGQIPHLDLLLSIDRLRGIQWIPGAGQPEPQEWPRVLRRIREAGKLCQLYVSAEGARSIVKTLGGRGFAFHILGMMSEGEAKDFLKLLDQEGGGRL